MPDSGSAEPLKLGGRELGGKGRTGAAGLNGRAGHADPTGQKCWLATTCVREQPQGRRKPKAARPRMRPQ